VKLMVREMARIEPEDAGPTDCPASDEAVFLEAAQGLLDGRERHPEHASELSGVALQEQAQGQKDPRPTFATEGA